MASIFHLQIFRLLPTAAAVSLVIFTGCGQVAGNYPPSRLADHRCRAIFNGPGYQLRAGSRLRVEKVEAELASLRDQGYSRHDPQIVKSVARRSEVPPGLLADRSGSAYYRVQVQLEPGVGLTLASGALQMAVATETGTVILRDEGYLLEDRRLPEGCRKPSGLALTLGASTGGAVLIREFLVRLPVRGEIVALEIVPDRVRKLPSP